MARGNTWLNADGLEVGFGVRDTHNIEDAIVHTLGRVKEVEVHIDHSTIAELATGTAPNSKHIEIPAGSVVRSAYLRVDTGFDALTSIVVGLKQQSDGATIDDDGLIASTLLAAIDTAGEVVVGAGAVIDAATETAVPAVVSLDVTGSAPTVGSAKLYVEYMEPLPSAEAPDVIVGEI